MDFTENRSKTLASIYQRYPEAQSADLGALKGDVGFWVILKDGATIFFRLIEPVVFDAEDGDLFWVFGE